jgi:hypothetical protein
MNLFENLFYYLQWSLLIKIYIGMQQVKSLIV